MAIDSLRKRASIVSLGLAFIGPSVVPDGTIAQADRAAIGNSYYGVTTAPGQITLGATCQLEAFDSSGSLIVERIIGATSQLESLTSSGYIVVGEQTIGATCQLEAFSSSGGITLEKIVGGTSQLESIASSGGITVGSFNGITPANRTLTVPADDRTLTVLADN